MTRLEHLISDLLYITDSLMALQNIYDGGSCNDCGNVETCAIRPKLGEQVRYNCPYHVGKPAGTEDGPKIDGGTVTDFVEYLNRKLLKHVEASVPNQELQEAAREIAKQFIEEYGE